jgi:Protein of unknown function (DUF3071)
MAHLTLAGLSDDGKRLLLVSDKGVEFTLDIDARLRAALRGEHASLGHLEIQMDSALRPRDIQARIRAGDTPEAVAQAAQTTVDRIMAFAAPVLAERQHVAERAQRSSVRRKPGESASSAARTLGDAVAGHLRSLNVDPETVSWDASRREDGRWTLTGDFAAGKRQGSATFIFDPPGNYVTVEDDDARWLLGEKGAEPQRPARDDLRAARGRRLSAVPGSKQAPEELPLDSAALGSPAVDPSALGDDAIELVKEESGSLGAEQPLEAYLDDGPSTQETPAVLEEQVAEQDPAAAEEPPAEEPPVRKAAKRKGRASVPSWDEIMFGGGKND